MTTLSSHKQKLLEEFDIFLTAMDNITDTQRKILKSEFIRAILKTSELTFNEVKPFEELGNNISVEARLGWKGAIETLKSNYEEYIK